MKNFKVIFLSTILTSIFNLSLNIKIVNAAPMAGSPEEKIVAPTATPTPSATPTPPPPGATTTTTLPAGATPTTTIPGFGTTTSTTLSVATTTTTVCSVYKANVQITATIDAADSINWYVDPQVFQWDDKLNLSCYKDTVNKVIRDAQAYAAGGAYWDDHAILTMIGQKLSQGSTYSYYTYVPDFMAESVCLAGMNHGCCTFCTASYAYFDENCNPVKPGAVRACNLIGTISLGGTLGTPVSLLWKNGYDIDSRTSFVKFPLEMNQPNKYWTWKASENAPLVVYDPSHQGDIKDATQLFGRWAFGGQKSASLNSTNDPAKPWSNGYEALQSLDTNADNKLSGEELGSLGLWFDSNTDAVSQKGEVKSMADAGVTAIFFNQDYQDPITKNVHSKLGFERKDGDKTISGSSVDWMGEGQGTLQELFNKYVMNQNVKSSTCKTPDKNNNNFFKQAVNLENLSKRTDRFSGIWEWQLDDKAFAEKTKNKGGYLMLLEDKNGDIAGQTVSDFPIEIKGRPEIKSMYMALAVAGQRIKLDAFNNKARFSTRLEAGEANLDSEAEINSDRTILKGTTITTAKLPGSEKKVEYRYNWTARRVQ